ncbi:hypothetical protein [Corallococcus sp. M7]
MGFWKTLFGKKSNEQRVTSRVISVLPPERVLTGGLPIHAIASTLHDPHGGPDGFEVNPAFVALLHQVVRECAPADPAAQAVAQRLGRGWLVISDQRLPPGQERVPPEDIIGSFTIEAGRISSEGYAPNAGYRVFTHHGLVRLPGTLQEILITRAAEDLRN